jgi:hypothetical protein
MMERDLQLLDDEEVSGYVVRLGGALAAVCRGGPS